VRRPEFRALHVVLGRHRSPHGRGDPIGWARTASNSPLLGTRPTPPAASRRAFRRLSGPHRALRDETRPPSATRADRTRAVARRRDNAPRRTPVSTRVTGTGPFTLRSAKRSGLKRVVCYACYAFKVCVGLAEWGRGRARVGGGHFVEGQAFSGATKNGQAGGLRS
jgi:hypothetical protein